MFFYRKAFTLVELIVVIGLVALIAVPGVYAIFNFRANQSLALSTEKFANVVQNAHIFAREAKDESEWGIRFVDSTTYTLMSRAGGVEKKVFTYQLESLSNFQGTPVDMWFSRSTGDLLGASEYTVVLVAGSGVSKQIHVNSLGTIDQT